MFVLAQNDPSSPETWDDYNYFNNVNKADESDEGEKVETGVLGNKRTDMRAQEQNSEQQHENEAEKHLDPFIE